MPNYADTFAELVRSRKSPLVVGIDPRWEQLPDALRQGDSLADKAEAYRKFSIGVIEAVAEVAPAVKPQAAFFEELGPAGMAALGDVIARAHGNRLHVILDGKRNDIGSTAEAYARGILGRDSAWGADSLTVSPYLGDDSLAPFVTTAIERDASLYVLVKTSNPGGKLWQDRVIDGAPLYRHVGEHVEHLAEKTAGDCGYGVVGAVVGATYPEQLAELRQAMPHTWFLVPGFGAQGGAAADVAGAFDEHGLGAVVNSSRGVIFAYNRPEYERFGQARWQEAVQQAARDATDQLRDATPAGSL